MEMMNRAIEDASAFTDFRDRLLRDEQRRLREAMLAGDPPSAETTPQLGAERQAGENRAAHRARLKAERRITSKAAR
jgi:hypothetical protein